MNAPDPHRRRSTRERLSSTGARAATRAALGTSSPQHTFSGLLFQALLLFALGTALLGLTAIIVWALVEGIPRMNMEVFTNGPSAVRPESAGFRTAILGTVYVISGVIVLIVPLGVGSAIQLEIFGDRTKWWNRIVDLNIQNLAGVPSIVFGILGMAFIARGPLGLGFVAATGSITLALLVLPTIIIASREAIRAVPSSMYDGALALGATPWQATRRLVLPAAVPGILTGVILSVARAIGEAAPLLLTGAVTFVTFDPRFWSGGYSTLPVMIFNYASRPQTEFRLLAAAGVIVMLVLVLVMNSFAVWLRNRYEQRY